MNDSRTRLAAMSQAEKALLLERLRERKQREAMGDQAIGPRDPAADPPPLSFAQRRLWFLDRLAPGDPAYNVPLAVWLHGPLDTGALARALAGVVARHEALRTTFPAAAEGPVQRIAPPAPFVLPRIDLTALGAAAPAAAVRLVRASAPAPFDLAAGPLLRSALLAVAPDLHLLDLTLHHIVSDGWSLQVLVREMAALYQGEALPPLPIQYADFAVWQRRRLSGEVLARQLGYWRERLAGLPAVLPLPTDRPRPPVRRTHGGLVPLALDPPTVDRVRELARELGATPFIVVLAAMLAWLRRLTGEDELAVGAPVANRDRPETAGLIGFFANTLVLRGDLAGDPTFRELVERVRPRAIEAVEHQDLPFERLVEELRPERDASRSPLVQVALNLQSGAEEPPPLGAVRIESLVDDEGGPVRFDLTLALGAGLSGALLYATALFDGTTARRLAAQWVRLLAAAVADPALRLTGLPLLSEPERAQVLHEANDTQHPGPAPLLLERLLAHARRAPDAVAVDAGDRQVTYGALATAAAHLGAHLKSLGVGPESIVALQADRSPELVLGLCAAWSAGAAYLPLDPALPAARRAWLLADAGATCLLAEPGTDLPPFEGPVVVLGSSSRSLPSLPSLPSFLPTNLAYLLYTSGSTGHPKGVLVPQSGLANLAAQLDRFAAGPGSRVLLFASPGFDASLLDLALALGSGATLCVAPARELPGLARLLVERGITHLHLPPSALAAVGGDGPPPGLEAVILGGEPIPAPLAACWGDGPRLWNDYGPTESTVFVTVDELGDGPLTLGRPIAGVEVYLLDRDLLPVPLGVPGEICLGGAGLARGYHGRPALTAERFIPHPLDRTDRSDPSDLSGARLYRTGDLARRLPDGRLDLLGRIDHQVKVRGFRIEPGEIEAALCRHPAVREAVVVPRGAGAQRSLAAWVVPAAEPVAPEELRDHLRAALPAWMVPASLVVVDRLPLTPNGKVDRRALAERAPALRPASGVAPAPPRTELERTLAAAWAELLGLERVGLDESFFDLGGHSLLLARLQAVLTERLGREVPLLALFEHPTVAALAAYLERAAAPAVQEAPADTREREERRREALDRQRRRLAGRRAGS